MDDLFRVAEVGGQIQPTEIDDVLRAPDLAGNPQSMLFRLSRAPFFLRDGVHELVDAIVEDDALVLARGGKIVLASHHSSGWIVYRRSK